MNGKILTAVRQPRASLNVGSRPSDARGDVRGRWFAILVAALLAFAWQSFLTQTHVHWASGGDASVATIGSGLANAASIKSPSSDDTADCPICEEMAHAGHLYLPAALSFPTPERGDAWITLSAPGLLAPSQSSHAWNSRAPPHILQA